MTAETSFQYTHRALIARCLLHHKLLAPENDPALGFLDAEKEVLPERDSAVELRKSMQIIDGRFRGRNDVDAAEKKHQGKNSEPENNFFLHRSIDRRISGFRYSISDKPLYLCDRYPLVGAGEYMKMARALSSE